MWAEGFVREGTEGATHLHLDIQNTHAPLLRDLLYSLDARAIIIPAKLGVLDKAAVVHKLQECVLAREVILDAVGLAGAGRACCV